MLIKEEYATWVDKTIWADLPDPDERLEMWNLGKNCQIHRHSILESTLQSARS